MRFLETVAAAISSKKFYTEAAHHSVKRALIYYIKLALTIAIFISVVQSIFTIPLLYKGLQSAGTYLYDTFPDDLVITSKAGEVSLNKEGPVVFAALDEITLNDRVYTNSFVIDTKATSSLEAYQAYSTMFLVTKDKIVYPDANGEVIINDVSLFPDITIDRNSVERAINISHYLPYVLPLLFLLAEIGAFIILLLYIFLLAVIFFGISRLWHSPLSFANSASVMIYSSTLALILNEVFLSGYVRIPLLFTLLSLLMAILMTKHIRSHHPTLFPQHDIH